MKKESLEHEVAIVREGIRRTGEILAAASKKIWPVSPRSPSAEIFLARSISDSTENSPAQRGGRKIRGWS